MLKILGTTVHNLVTQATGICAPLINNSQSLIIRNSGGHEQKL
jgi:cysteine sulfinate desulfinase/cysteine desulfurase-like protein